MPIDLQVIRASEFVRLGARGVLNFEASKEALRTLARACWTRALNSALLDLRAVPTPARPLFTPAELAALVETFREAGFTRQQRLAILYRSDLHGGARMFAFISRIKGLQVQAFGEFEAALNWLSEERVKKTQRHGQTIPIKFLSSRASEAKKADKPAARRAQ